MKKTVALLMLLVLALGSAKAHPVSPATARQVANTWMQAMGMENVKALLDVTAQTPFTEFYLFAAPDSGFVLVSGDDCAVPVLGYSVENSFPTKDIPQHVLSFLSDYEEEIRWCKQHPIDIADTVARQWQLLRGGQMPKASFEHGVMPLLVIRWNQRPYYNSLCPVYDDTNHFPVGCGATAMAQVMKYWNFPERGYGSHSYEHRFLGTISANFGATTYDWTHMPYQLTATSSAEEVEAVARLMYHCGVAVDIDYDYDGSGSPMLNIYKAFYKYFKYRSDIKWVLRKHYSDSEFGELMRAELDEGRPMLLEGKPNLTTEHAFVCDGYSTHNYFHYNLGWGGFLSGYYVLCGQMGKGQFSQTCVVHDAFMGIQPNADWDSAGSTTVTASVVGASATVSGAGTYPFDSTITIRVDSVEDGYRFARWSDGSKENPRKIVATGGSYHFTALLEPITGDTLSYCGDHCSILSAYSLVDSSVQWGIYLPQTLFAASDTLSAVQLLTISQGDYFMSIYRDTVDSAHLLYTSTSHYENDGWGEVQWHTIPLSTPIVVDSTQSLYILFESPNALFPAAFTDHYAGPPHSSLSIYQGEEYYDDEYCWTIRAILGTHEDPVLPDYCDGVFHLPYYIGNDSAAFHDNAPCWTTLDADGDSNNWVALTSYFSSFSWNNDTVFTPDNWLFSPAIELPNVPCSLRWRNKFNKRYYNEHYNVYISTTGTDTADFTLLAEYTGDTSGEWTMHEITLDQWSDNIVHFAFRHFNSTDQNYVRIRDIQIATIDDNAIDVYADNPAWGSVTGAGSYPHGSDVTIEAIPFEGSTFHGWSNGVADNPYTLTLASDTVLTALFLNTTGIENVDYEEINIYIRNGRLVVEGAEGEMVQLFDLEGRRLPTDIPLTTGVYMVQVGSRAAQKVIVIQ